MNKIITDELINKRLEARGFGEKQANDPELAQQSVFNHFGVKLVDEWVDNAEYYIYEESTSDGYSVYIATYNPNSISINEDIHYYDSELGETLAEAIRYGNGDPEYPDTIYVDDVCAQYVDDAVVDLFDYLAIRFEEEIIDELKDEGYEYEDEEE